MKPGDMALAVNTSAWYAWIITVVTRARYSHVRLIISPDGTCVEAVAGGVRYGKIGAEDVVLSPPLTAAQRQLVPALAAALVGLPYGWVDVAVLGLAQVGIRLPGLTRKLEDPGRLFCSQLVDYVWRQAGYRAFDDGRLSQNVSPGDLADLGLRWNSILPTTDRKTSARTPARKARR